VAEDLVEKFLSHFDPARRGFTDAGMANGVSAVGGWFFPRITGGYNLKRGTSRDDVSVVVGTAQPGATTIAEFAHAARDPSETYHYAVVPIGPGGVEAVVPDSDIVTVAAVEPAPDAPQRLACKPIAGGKFRLTWHYATMPNRTAATAFVIYSDNGTGTMDYATPLDVIAAVGTRPYSWESAAFAHGTTVQFVVRSRAGGGIGLIVSNVEIVGAAPDQRARFTFDGNATAHAMGLDGAVQISRDGIAWNSSKGSTQYAANAADVAFSESLDGDEISWRIVSAPQVVTGDSVAIAYPQAGSVGQGADGIIEEANAVTVSGTADAVGPAGVSISEADLSEDF
jgi:hypothetical protein